MFAMSLKIKSILLSFEKGLRLFLGKIFAISGRSKAISLFNCPHGYQDNTKYLFEYYLHKDEPCFWVSNDKKEYEVLKAKGIPVLQNGTFSFFKILLKTKAVYVTHSYKSVCRFLPSNILRVNLWHGIALKKMGYDTIRDAKKIGTFNPYDEYDYFVVSSDAMVSVFRSCLNVQSSKILPLGQPRNDFLIDNKKDDRCKYKLLKKFSINLRSKVFLYAPTFRDITDPVEGYKKLVNEWQEYHKKNPYTCLIIKPHPKEIRMFAYFKAKGVQIIDKADIQELLLVTDCLISDYSSLIFDFMLLGKPIVLYAFDRESYIKGRDGFYFDYEDVMNGCIICCDSKDIYKFLDDINVVQYKWCDKLHNLNASENIHKYFLDRHGF